MENRFMPGRTGVLDGRTEEELEELARDKLEESTEEDLEASRENSSYDVVYRRNHDNRDLSGARYELDQNSKWYDSEVLDEVETDLDIGITEICMNVITGETKLETSDGKTIHYNLISSYEGSTTLARKMGENWFALRYLKNEDILNGTILDKESKNVAPMNESMKKQIDFIDNFYHSVQEKLWEKETNDKVKTTTPKFDRLKPVYQGVTGRIEQGENDKCIITEGTHLGDFRGPDIANAFFSATVRHPRDSPENYKENRGKGDLPITIEPVE